MYVSTKVSNATTAAARYLRQDRNELHTIFERHFADFGDHYKAKYAATYGIYCSSSFTCTRIG